MRYFWLLLVVALGALYFFFGLRVGYVSLTPAWMANAQGVSTYHYKLLPADVGTSFVRVAGSCDARGGQVTLSFTAPSGQQVGSQVCRGGRYSLGLTGQGETGDYLLTVTYQHYTGRLELVEQRQ